MIGPATQHDDADLEPDESIDRFRKRLQEALERAGGSARTEAAPEQQPEPPPAQRGAPAVPASRRPRAGARHARPG
ncbi:MAG: hypothetical protein ACXVGH_04085 [Mycobacteriales bacterium]